MKKKLSLIIEELEALKARCLAKAKKWELEAKVTKDRKCEMWAEWYQTRAFEVDESISIIKKHIGKEEVKWAKELK